jgi:hypothetical protein
MVNHGPDRSAPMAAPLNVSYHEAMPACGLGAVTGMDVEEDP